jgi:glycosyltransferase involved in cell wall biosynthesis
MHFTFILPHYKRHLPGGYRIFLDYAVRLGQLGHTIDCVIPWLPHTVFSPKDLQNLTWLQKLSILIKGLLRIIVRHCRASIHYLKYRQQKIDWEGLDSIRVHQPWSLNQWKNSESCDAVLVSWWENAWWLHSAKIDSHTRRIFVCQGYEDWGGVASWVEPSYEFQNLELISVSASVQNQIFNKHRRHSFKLINGINPHLFENQKPWTHRPFQLGLIFRTGEVWKGLQLAESVLALCPPHFKICIASFDASQIHLKDPRITILTCKSSTDMQNFYNQSQVFVFTSLKEGYGLPIAEAMLCGCHVVSTPVGCAPDLLGQAGAGTMCQSFEATELHNALMTALDAGENSPQWSAAEAQRRVQAVDPAHQAQELLRWLSGPKASTSGAAAQS